MRNTVAVAALLAASTVLGGCELTDSGTNVVHGKQLFVQKCGACHVLSRAGTTGVAGPNLDEAFQRARQDGFGQDTFEGLVHQQILQPGLRPQRDPETGKEGAKMPANLVSGDDAEDVAAYVAEAAGKPGKDTGTLAQVGAAEAKGTAEEKDGEITIPADPSGSLAYQFAEAEGKPGQVTLRSPNESSIDHDISIEGNGLDEHGEVVKNGGVSEIKVNLQPGDYTFYCSVPGHREGGMEGKLTVK